MTSWPTTRNVTEIPSKHSNSSFFYFCSWSTSFSIIPFTSILLRERANLCANTCLSQPHENKLSLLGCHANPRTKSSWRSSSYLKKYKDFTLLSWTIHYSIKFSLETCDHICGHSPLQVPDCMQYKTQPSQSQVYTQCFDLVISGVFVLGYDSWKDFRTHLGGTPSQTALRDSRRWQKLSVF